MIRCLKRARDGDPSATKDLVEALRPRITRMAVYYARRTGEDPDDLLQEAWLGLLEALPQLDMGIGSPQQYLIACARWRLLDAIKRARVRRCVSLDEEEEAGLPPRSTEACLAAACVSEFVGQLREPQREALNCLLDGLTWREAGQALGCTSANIGYHVRQIRWKYEEWEES